MWLLTNSNRIINKECLCVLYKVKRERKSLSIAAANTNRPEEKNPITDNVTNYNADKSRNSKKYFKQ